MTEPSKKFKKIIAAALLLSILVPLLAIPEPAKAQATFQDPWNLIVNTLTSQSNSLVSAATQTLSGLTNSLVTKEYILDAIAGYVSKNLIRVFASQIVNWIKTGDSRGPLVIDNFLDHFMREMDNAAGLFLQKYFGANSQLLGLVCQPFRIALPPLLNARARGPSYSERARCKLSDIVRNVQNFQPQVYFNDFSQGGWDAWFASLDPSGNILGQYLAGASEMDRRTGAAYIGSQTEAQTTGGGLLSWQQCTPGTVDITDDETGEVGTVTWENCKTQTPGGLVQDQLKSSETSWIRQLEVSNEINQILNTFFQEMLAGLLSPNGGFFNRNAAQINTAAPPPPAPLPPTLPPPPTPQPPSFINVTSATYAGNCNAPTNVPSVATQCNGKELCSYTMLYTVDPGFDPAVGCGKNLFIVYTCTNKGTRVASVPGEAGLGSLAVLNCTTP